MMAGTTTGKMREYTIGGIRDLICFECVAGSRAHGLETEKSDEDRKGVYMAPLVDVLSGVAPGSVFDEKQDLQYTEIGEFCRQLMLNNSGALELWGCLGQEQQIFAAPWFTQFFGERNFLSRKCRYTFAANANRQVKRVQATHEKALRPPDESLSLADFCAVLHEGACIPLRSWMAGQGVDEHALLAAPMEGCPHTFALYRGENRGGLFGKSGTAVSCPQVPAGAPFLCHIVVHEDEFSRHCCRVAQYRQWLQERNTKRLDTALDVDHGGAYDCKHMGHVVRLLHMAREIARGGRVHVRRTWDNALLRDIRAGRVPLDELMRMVDALLAELPAEYEASDLPESPQVSNLEQDLAQLRIDYERHLHAN